jgi:hypothetical protein
MFIVVLALVQAIMYGWIFGIERGEQELHRGAHMRVPRFVQWVLKFVTPVFLFAILVGVCVKDGRNYINTLAQGGVPLYSVLFIGVVFVFLLLLVNIAGQRWKREGRLKF